jgi:hypothetical protein
MSVALAPVPSDSLRDLFKAEASPAFVTDVLQALVAAYSRSAEEATSRHESPEARYLAPHLRRVYLEEDLRAVAVKHGLDAVAAENRTNTCSHTEIRLGRIVLTASHVNGPYEVVQWAQFRQTLAQESQLSLPEFGREVKVPDDAQVVYGLLIHGCGNNPRWPSFAHVVFPDPTCSKYLERISLDSDLQALLSGARTEWEQISDESEPEFTLDLDRSDAE